jgi:hypothetical protein
VTSSADMLAVAAAPAAVAASAVKHPTVVTKTWRGLENELEGG